MKDMHAHLCFCSFSCLVAKIMITLKKSHTKQTSNAIIIKNCCKNQILRYFLPLGTAVVC